MEVVELEDWAEVMVEGARKVDCMEKGMTEDREEALETEAWEVVLSEEAAPMEETLVASAGVTAVVVRERRMPALQRRFRDSGLHPRGVRATWIASHHFSRSPHVVQLCLPTPDRA